MTVLMMVMVVVVLPVVCFAAIIRLHSCGIHPP